jgi:WD40 repeat protein
MLRLWDTETRKPIGEPFKGHEGFVYSAAFSPNDSRIVTASDDKTVRLWDIDTNKPNAELITDTDRTAPGIADRRGVRLPGL